MAEHIGGRMRLPTADANFDRDIAHLVLHVVRQRSDFRDGIRNAGGQFGNSLFDLRPGNTALRTERAVPLADILPRASCLRAGRDCPPRGGEVGPNRGLNSRIEQPGASSCARLKRGYDADAGWTTIAGA